MEKYISNMPVWAIVLFIISFILMLGMIANPFRKAALASGMTVKQSGMVRTGILVFYLLWLAYASVLSLTGVFDVNALPPRVMMLTAVPLLLILFGIVGNTALFKKLLQSSSLESLVFIHVFRFEGVFFLLLAWYKILEPGFAISAGVGDILTAILAIPVARAVARGLPWSKKAVIAWNILGIMDIVTLMTFAIVGAVKSQAPGGGEMTTFPFSWFPAFAPATILFLHAMVFRKLWAEYAGRRLHFNT